MIVSFRCRETEKIYQGIVSSRLPGNIQQTALRKLLALEAAHALKDLRVPPGNRLEALAGDKKGQYSIWINDQWRICFTWKGRNVHNVYIVDYHRG